MENSRIILAQREHSRIAINHMINKLLRHRRGFRESLWFTFSHSMQNILCEIIYGAAYFCFEKSAVTRRLTTEH